MSIDYPKNSDCIPDVEKCNQMNISNNSYNYGEIEKGKNIQLFSELLEEFFNGINILNQNISGKSQDEIKELFEEEIMNIHFKLGLLNIPIEIRIQLFDFFKDILLQIQKLSLDGNLSQKDIDEIIIFTENRISKLFINKKTED